MIIINNKKALFNYFLEDYYEAGIVLKGWEVKSIRANHVHLKESYIITRNKEIFLFGAHISVLSNSNIFTNISSETIRTRKLLLHSTEIKKLTGKVKKSGYTLIPSKLYFVKNRIKCEIALAKGKKQHDKRRKERDRDIKRETEIIIKKYKNKF
ncbi:SsrA-binding protein SmpB [Candidatus Profftella armatura (Diaphorina cf. continua)]|uniref:SsrA-binding protein n=1 Tax=Candidatus Profftella armatura (Diaphorina cf. continua) TaxID=2661583 RepID=A0A7R6VZ36_9PROT|nr:SsrA-binding protein SmpB [Candidatus Profftella armatura (Diaphorina cf. continua)]BCG49686.1 SsrA-binding protein SmpB [Candidatus Profftella armatura (Diaphorina cf. continua)]